MALQAWFNQSDTVRPNEIINPISRINVTVPSTEYPTIINPSLVPPISSCSKGAVVLPQSTITHSQSSVTLMALRRFLENPMAMFKSRHQHQAADIVYHLNQSALVVLPTSGGKSILFCLASCAQPQKCVLVVVPLISLQDDLIRRFGDKFSCCTSIEDYNGHQLLILTYEHAVTNTALSRLHLLAHNGHLSKVFIDEAHCFILDAAFRTEVRKLAWLESLGVPIVFLFATLTENVAQFTIKSFFGNARIPIVRAPTVRPNLKYCVIKNAKRDGILSLVLRSVGELGEGGRALMFFAGKQTLREWEAFLCSSDVPCKAYHADLDLEERKSNLSALINGEIKLLLCTSAFGLGVDLKTVRHVFIVDLPYTFEDYIQQGGRAGRDGNIASVTLFANNKSHEREPKGGDFFEGSLKYLQEYVQASSCRRSLISAYMDREITSCYFEDGAVKCDNCLLNLESPPMPLLTLSTRTPSQQQPQINQSQCILTRLPALLIDIKTLCPICFAHNEKNEHQSCKCKRMIGKCLRCLEKGHSLKDCRQHWAKPQNDSCNKCLFPKSVGDHGSCPENFCREFGMELYNLESPRLGEKLLQLSRPSFMNWLVQECLGVRNGLHILIGTPTEKLQHGTRFFN